MNKIKIFIGNPILRRVSASFWLTHVLFPAIIGLVLVFIYPRTGLDKVLIAPYFEPVLKTFPLRRDPFMENVMHAGIKYAIITLSIVVLSFAIFSFFYKPYIIYRRKLVWTFIGLIASTTIISILKHYSIHGCPWNLIEYGGKLPELELFASLPEGVKPGHCFPGGHASAGFALMTFYFVFRDKAPVLAIRILWFALLIGMIMGWSQMVRGAHFLSHNLWTAWIIWMLLVTMYICWPPNQPVRKQNEDDY